MAGYGPPWTQAEDETIRQHAGLLPVRDIVAMMPGRTHSGTMQRAVNGLRISLRLGVRWPGDPPLKLPGEPIKRRPRVGGISKAGPPPEELLSEEGARLLIGLAKTHKRTPRALVTALMEIVVREPALIDNILDEG